jgi:pimeloyl-ACP methyl ester carboxylesterase
MPARPAWQSTPANLSHASTIVVFVHGAMDRATSFDRVRRRMAQLTTRPNVVSVAYDRRGYAASTSIPFGNDPFADHVGDLNAIIDELHAVAPQAQVVLVGHSAGSNVAFSVASTRPEIAAVVGFEPPMPWLEWWPSFAGGSTLSVFKASGPEAAAEAFMRRIVGDDRWERLPASTKAARRAEGLALVADLSTLRGRPAQFDHAAIRCPAVVGHGGKSLPHQQRSTEVAVELIGSQCQLRVIPEAGHGAHGSHPDQFVDLILVALDLIPSSG